MKTTIAFAVFLSLNLARLNVSAQEEVRIQPSEHLPLYFVDSVRAQPDILTSIAQDSVAMITVIKDSLAINKYGPEAKYGGIYIETKSFVKNRYWKLFKNRSKKYVKLVLNPTNEKGIIYILNGKPLEEKQYYELGGITDSNLVSISILNKKQLLKQYQLNNYTKGVVVITKPALQNAK